MIERKRKGEASTSAPPNKQSDTDFTDLPFVGRERELNAILSFYHQTVRQDGLASLWLQGEAGIGKSRLLNAAAAKFIEEGSSVLHLKVYPDTASSLISLIGRTIEMDSKLHSLLRVPVQGDLSSVMHGLRRLARLRSIVLIVEDLHLLNQEAASDFSRLLAGLSEEQIAVIAAARPQESSAYAILLPYQRAFLDVQGLTIDEISTLIERKGIQPNEETIVRFYEITSGNPLLIRLTFPFFSNVNASKNETSTLLRELQLNLKHKARLSREAVLSHYLANLTPEERRGAELLALLGEVFSGETAARLLPEASQIIPKLLRQGVICHQILPVRSISGEQTNDEIFAFTHSLLHDRLIDTISTESGKLLEILHPDVTLYSLTPLRQIFNIVNPEILPETACHILDMFSQILYGDKAYRHDWQTRKTVLEFAWQFFRMVSHLLDSEHKRSYNLHLIRYQVVIWNNLPLTPEFQEPFKALEGLEVVTREDALHYIAFFALALSYYRYLYTNNPAYDPEEAVRNILDKLEQLNNRFNDLRKESDYDFMMMYLGDFLPIISRESPVMTKAINEYNRFKGEYEEALGSEVARRKLAPIETRFLLVFRNAEELEQKHHLAETLLSPGGALSQPDLNVTLHFDLIPVARFYSETGMSFQAWKIVQNYVQHMPTGARLSWEINLIGTYFILLSTMGSPLESIESILKEVMQRYNRLGIDVDQTKSSHPTYARIAIASAMTAIGYAREDLSWSEHVIETMVGVDASQLKRLQMMKAIVAHDRQTLQQFLADDQVPQIYAPFIKAVLNPIEEEKIPELLLQAERELRSTILSLPDIVRLTIFLHLFEQVQLQGQSLNERRIDTVRETIRGALRWSVEYNAPGLTPFFLRFAKRYLNRDEYSSWQQQAERLQKQMNDTVEWNLLTPYNYNSREHLPHLSLIGQITLTFPNQEGRRLQGTRIRQVLGMIVANQLLSKPLSLADFRELATDKEAEPENAGNNLRVTVSRLRQIIGDKGAIVSDGERPPQLQIERITVDVLEAATLFDQANEAVRNNRLRKAREFVEQGLQIIGNEPIYPSLYGEFFEAARFDFELRVEQAILNVASRLREEEDLEEGINFLYRGMKALPDNEQIMEMLTETLERLGRTVEALTIRNRFAREIGEA